MLLVAHEWRTLGEGMLRMRFLFLLTALIGCDFDPVGFGTPTITRRGSCDAHDGIVSLAWTIRGQTPTATSCQGIQKLVVSLDGANCGATITPVPCALDKRRYDHIVEGRVTVNISALDNAGNEVAHGETIVDLTRSVPSMPVALDVR
jgi:hypothetical protein